MAQQRGTSTWLATGSTLAAISLAGLLLAFGTRISNLSDERDQLRLDLLQAATALDDANGELAAISGDRDSALDRAAETSGELAAAYESTEQQVGQLSANLTELVDERDALDREVDRLERRNEAIADELLASIHRWATGEVSRVSA